MYLRRFAQSHFASPGSLRSAMYVPEVTRTHSARRPGRRIACARVGVHALREGLFFFAEKFVHFDRIQQNLAQ